MRDDQYTGQGGKTAAERLVFQDKVKFIVGPIGSNPVLSTVQVTTPEKVLLMSNGFAPAILKNDHKASYNFRFTLTNVEYRTQHDEVGEGQSEAQEGRHPRAE